MERQPTGHLMGNLRISQPKLEAIASAQQTGHIGDAAGHADPFDVMAMVIAMSMAWSPVSNVYAATRDEAATLHERRRDLISTTFHRAFGP